LEAHCHGQCRGKVEPKASDDPKRITQIDEAIRIEVEEGEIFLEGGCVSTHCYAEAGVIAKSGRCGLLKWNSWNVYFTLEILTWNES
jgi:hypothetical protein